MVSESEFWQRLESACQPNTPKNWDDCCERLRKAVLKSPSQSSLLLKGGRAVFSDLRFSRIEKIGPFFVNLIPDDCRKKKGISAGNIEAITLFLESEFAAISPIPMGKPDEVVWAFFPTDIDIEAVSVQEACITVGIEFGYKNYIYWEYEAISESFCPTVLDALDFPYFKPSPPRSATGYTCPTVSGYNPVREVVHKPAPVNIVWFKVLRFEQPGKVLTA